MNECVDGLMHSVDAKASKESSMNVYELFQHLTLDSISRCAFGFQPTPSQKKEDDFLSLCAATFADTVEDNWLLTCSKLLPAFRLLWSKVYFKIFVLLGVPFRRIDGMLKNIINAREEGKSNGSRGNVALLDILIDCEVKNGELVDVDAMLQEETLDSDRIIVKKIFPEEMVSQCTLYMLAGYETTSNALSFMEGGIPVLVVSDLEILNDIFIKKFNSFHARKLTYVDFHEGGQKRIQMFFSNGLRWKRLRTISSPAFSTIRLKQISPIMNECVDGLMHSVDAKASKESSVNVYELFQRLTLNTISRCAFGFQPTPSQKKKDDFLSLCAATFGDMVEDNWLFTCTKLLPGFRRLWSIIYFKIFALLGLLPFRHIDRMLETFINAREKKKSNGCKGNVALIDILIVCELKRDELVDVDAMLEQETLDSSRVIVKKIFPEELISQCTLYMLAGYETTSNALSYSVYELARHPEIQEKLRSEIMDYHKNEDEKPSYESVEGMVYLDCVIRETLRCYPLASGVVNRRCMHTCTTGGFTIEKGMDVVVDVWSIHYNKDIWGPDADEFVPERFAEGQLHSLHPLAWIPFGAGPRRCIGERFALLEMKLTLARLLRKYRIFLNDRTEIPLELKEGMTTTPKNGVVLSLKLI
ncbi:unspecific monooxygenase [Trichuris suis]|nr:unspecific monooxygenase [Trichuris suis]